MSDVMAYSIDPIHIKYICPFGCQDPNWVRKKAFHQHGSNREAHNRVEYRCCDNCPFYHGEISIHITDDTIRKDFVVKTKKDIIVSFD
mgnify:CR=1 FL=1